MFVYVLQLRIMPLGEIRQIGSLAPILQSSDPTIFRFSDSPIMATASFRSNASTLAQLTRDLLKLSKHRLSALVAVTSGAGYALRYDDATLNSTSPVKTSTHYWRQLFAVTTGTWLTAACANTLNQMYEIRSDALMARTKSRPLPAGRIGLAQAGFFALVTGCAGVGLLAKETNATAAGMAAANAALYAGVYTPLKAVSTVNTWIGAVVGAMPPMLGWAAASDGRLLGEREKGAWALGGLLFLWQIPHFHALAVVSRADYAAGGLKMLAVANPVRNALWARVTAGMMVPIGMAFVESGVASGAFGIEMALLGLWMYRGAGRLMVEPTSVKAARGLFKASIFHLPVALGLLMAHHVPYKKGVQERKMMDREVRLYHPWEVMAPFPFLPVPLSVPLVVIEAEER